MPWDCSRKAGRRREGKALPSSGQPPPRPQCLEASSGALPAEGICTRLRAARAPTGAIRVMEEEERRRWITEIGRFHRNPDLIHTGPCRYCARAYHPIVCHHTIPISQAMRVDYRNKSLSAVMNEALVSGHCSLYSIRVKPGGEGE